MDSLFFIFEIIGTIAFAISGAMVGIKKNMDILGVIILGLTTAVGGGVLRDVFALSAPHIFVKHFYACASIIGTLICVLLWGVVGEVFSMIIGALIIILLRFLAAKYRWELPKPNEKK